MGRVERVADDGPLRTPALGLHDAHRDARRARGDDRVGRRGVVDVGEQLDLEFRALRRVLLNEVGVAEGLRQVRGELQAIRGGAGRESQLVTAVPRTLDVGPQCRLGARRRIGGRDIEAVGEIVRRPTRTDGAGADDCDALHWLCELMIVAPLLRLVVSARARRVHVFRRTPRAPSCASSLSSRLCASSSWRVNASASSRPWVSRRTCLTFAKRQRCVDGDARSKLLRPSQCGPGFGQLTDKPVLLGIDGRKRLAGEQHLEGDVVGDALRQPDDAALAGDESPFHLGQPEFGVVAPRRSGRRPAPFRSHRRAPILRPPRSAACAPRLG